MRNIHGLKAHRVASYIRSVPTRNSQPVGTQNLVWHSALGQPTAQSPSLTLAPADQPSFPLHGQPYQLSCMYGSRSLNVARVGGAWGPNSRGGRSSIK